jgi:hypothetical protein
MKIRYQRINYLEFIAGLNEKRRFATGGFDS